MGECALAHYSDDISRLSVFHVLHECLCIHLVHHRHRPLEISDALRMFVPMGHHVAAEFAQLRWRVDDPGRMHCHSPCYTRRLFLCVYDWYPIDTVASVL